MLKHENSILKIQNRKALQMPVNQVLEGLFYGALNQNRTDDPILTMDVLYLLSYEGEVWSG
jgi:hypothetical protein